MINQSADGLACSLLNDLHNVVKGDSAVHNIADDNKTAVAPSEAAGAASGYHLVTIVTNRRVQIFASRELARIATEVILFHERKGAFRLRGYIVMPDHIQIICEPTDSLDHVIRNIKKLISSMAISHLAVTGGSMLRSIQSPAHQEEGPLFELWRKGHYHVRIPSEEKLNESLRYLYEAPVRSGICANAFEYEFSDIHRYLGSAFLAEADRSRLFLGKKPAVSGPSAGKKAKGRPPSAPA